MTPPLFVSRNFLVHKKPEKMGNGPFLIKTYPKGDMKKRAEELLPKLEKSGPLSEADKTDLFKEEEAREEEKAAGSKPGNLSANYRSASLVDLLYPRRRRWRQGLTARDC
jgi:hypothetical protein